MEDQRKILSELKLKKTFETVENIINELLIYLKIICDISVLIIIIFSDGGHAMKY